jgi:hypothetical protein
VVEEHQNRKRSRPRWRDASKLMRKKRKDGGPPGETRDSKAERIHATAMAIIEKDAQHTQAKTERLKAMRLAKEAGSKAVAKGSLATIVRPRHKT